MMQTEEKTKRLVMIGISRKGEKGFQTRTRKDISFPLPEVATLRDKTVDQSPEKHNLQ